MQAILHKLYSAQTLVKEESEQLFASIIAGQLAAEQLSAALISMKVRGESVAEIAGAAQALLAAAKPFPRPDYDFADIVGTGGDGQHTINISTASAFVAACCGVKVAKHGNRGVSSQTGSSDLLTALGVPLQLSAEQSRAALDALGICFLFAPHYHQGFAHAASVRQRLQTRTIFNLLGPLINPARPPIALIGVYDRQLVIPMAKTLQQLGYQRAAVVYGSGLDEVAVHGVTDVAELNAGEIDYYHLLPDDFGLPCYPLARLQGGSPTENQQLITQLLQGRGDPAHAAAIAANVALLLKLFGQDNLPQNAQHALAVLASGQAHQRLMALAVIGRAA